MGGWVRAKKGESEVGIAMLRQGLADWSATGAETHRTYFEGLLAEALGDAGDYNAAISLCNGALGRKHGAGAVFHIAELHRLKGEFLLRQGGASGDAEKCFREALAIATKQRAKSLELRAAMSLCRLYQSQGRPTDARTILAERYAWFTEGFTTPDLQDARHLLEQLA